FTGPVMWSEFAGELERVERVEFKVTDGIMTGVVEPAGVWQLHRENAVDQTFGRREGTVVMLINRQDGRAAAEGFVAVGVNGALDPPTCVVVEVSVEPVEHGGLPLRRATGTHAVAMHATPEQMGAGPLCGPVD